MIAVRQRAYKAQEGRGLVAAGVLGDSLAELGLRLMHCQASEAGN